MEVAKLRETSIYDEILKSDSVTHVKYDPGASPMCTRSDEQETDWIIHLLMKRSELFPAAARDVIHSVRDCANSIVSGKLHLKPPTKRFTQIALRNPQAPCTGIVFRYKR